MKYALIGNPNCGKTTLFNSLTGATLRTGNWPGVTVEKKEGKYKEHSIIDLPGVYSLSPYTPEEVVSRNFLLQEEVDCIINIVDASNLERNLYLTLQCLELDIPLVIAFNMVEIAKEHGVSYDINAISKKLGVPCIEISALKKQHLDELMSLVEESSKIKRDGFSVLKAVKNHKLDTKHSAFITSKLLEGDKLISEEYNALNEIINSAKNHTDEEYSNLFVEERYNYIEKELKITIQDKKSKTEKIDNVLTHKIWGIPLFMAIMFFVFHLTFSEDFLFLGTLGIIPEGFSVPIIGEGAIASPGIILFNLMDLLVSLIGDGLQQLFANAPEWCSSLIVDGVWGGVGAILSFIPIILVLFLFIAILEDCGYMSRVAFLMDRLFRSIGLSGKAFIPLLSCFGCAVPGIMATKTLKSDKERRIAIMLTPFFSCGAKLPIWTAFAAVLFAGAYADMIVFGVYFFGIIVSIISAIILNKLIKGEQEAFIMELPTYHRPQAKTIFLLLWDKAKDYLIKAATLIAGSTVVLWVLTSFDWTFTMVDDIDNSIIGSISNFIAPVFYPLGFGRGEYASVFVIASFAGLIAKEEVPVVLESLGVLELAVASVTPAAIFAFMAFNLLVVPCMAAVATARGELNNKKHFWLAILFWVVIAYVFGMIVYVIATLISQAWWVSLILLALLLAAIILYIIHINKNKEVEVCN
ncbi:MAG: ferrous iron transport protein B [Acholeplasmatales bacterium]|nr:ferrous iron transport protein B [Acholeplasmatales bacterium]